MFRKIPDSRIIEGIRRQDDETLSWLYDNYRESVRHHVLKNNGSEADVSDVFQEAIITLYTQITTDGINLSSDLKGYFFGIARNIWNTHLRRMSKNTTLDLDIADDSGSEDGAQVLERIVSRAFQKLSPDAQTILTLFSEGFSYEEIAVKMNLKNEVYARRKKYISKENLMGFIKEDPEYSSYLG